MLVDLIDTNSHQFLLSGVSDLDVFSTMTAQPGGIVMDEDVCSEDSEETNLSTSHPFLSTSVNKTQPDQT